MGLSQQALVWFNSYLYNHPQCVSFHHNKSDSLIIEKGVPQGSILGPLIMINDLSLIVQLYADDMVIQYIHLTPMYLKFRAFGQ